MKRTAIILIWLGTLVGAYLAGAYQSGSGQGATQSGSAIDSADGPAKARTADRSGLAPVRSPRSGSASGPHYDFHPSNSNESARQDPVALAEQLTAEGRPSEALEILTRYLETEAHDARALFLLSDLRQMTGAADQALLPLIAVLQVPPTPAAAARARKRLDLLINAREQQLINATDLAGLVAFFETLVAVEPGYDGHRLKLARWLLRSGEPDNAAQLLKEVGYQGVTQAEIDALAGEIELARTTLPVEQVGGSLFTGAAVSAGRGTAEYRFLIDTGATMTGLAVSRLEALGAVKVDAGVNVQTANGIARLPVYRIGELKLAGLILKDMNVLGFSDLPRDADGLLGMDVLSQLPGRLSGAVPTPVGRP